MVVEERDRQVAVTPETAAEMAKTVTVAVEEGLVQA